MQFVQLYSKITKIKTLKEVAIYKNLVDTLYYEEILSSYQRWMLIRMLYNKLKKFDISVSEKDFEDFMQSI